MHNDNEQRDISFPRCSCSLCVYVSVYMRMKGINSDLERRESIRSVPTKYCRK